MPIEFPVPPPSRGLIRSLASAESNLNRSIQRLASGLRINSAADDPAGASIATRMRGRVVSIDRASQNVGEAASLLATADGAMESTSEVLIRMRELTVAAASDTMSSSDRTAVKTELDLLSAELDRIGNQTSYNGKVLLDGSASFTFQIGADASATTSVALDDVRAASLDVKPGDLVVSTAANASTTLGKIDAAIDELATTRSKVGARINRLAFTASALSVESENLNASVSRIRDADQAQESTRMLQAKLLQESARAMMAQVNSGNDSLLRMIRGS
ncbi:MAG: flagellin [Candidatus Sericytochromatia bacterium]|nr:flagellin [Candidatus Tanganyikabacteria bacterium]